MPPVIASTARSSCSRRPQLAQEVDDAPGDELVRPRLLELEVPDAALDDDLVHRPSRLCDRRLRGARARGLRV